MSDVCPKCGKVHLGRKETGVYIAEHDMADLQLIVNALNNASQALNPKNIPEDASQSQVDKWIQANQKILAGYQVLEAEWWQKTMKTYEDRLEKDAQYTLNFATGELLKME